jgi:predicted regulator of Ras-like GTPase activity (Roadblock/LC7/MglB family)
MKLTRDKLSALLGFKSRDKTIVAEKPTILEEPVGLSEEPNLPQPVVNELIDEQVDVIHSTRLSSDIESTDNEIEVEIQESSMEQEDLVIANFSKEQLSQSQEKLAEFMRSCPGAYGVLISTVDGHEIAYSLKRDMPPHKISTMNSSLLALGESIARESLQQLCQFVILENSDGRVVSLRINQILMLTCISTKNTNLGMLLSAGRNTADSLAKIL